MNCQSVCSKTRGLVGGEVFIIVEIEGYQMIQRRWTKNETLLWRILHCTFNF